MTLIKAVLVLMFMSVLAPAFAHYPAPEPDPSPVPTATTAPASHHGESGFVRFLKGSAAVAGIVCVGNAAYVAIKEHRFGGWCIDPFRSEPAPIDPDPLTVAPPPPPPKFNGRLDVEISR